MANVTYSAGIDHVSGALAKPSKSGQHSCEKMLLATHRTAATTSNKCNRLYLREPVKRTSPLSQRELENRAKFMVVSGMIKARKADLMKITTDQQNFLAQACVRLVTTRDSVAQWKLALPLLPLPIANSLRLRFTLGTPEAV